MFFATRYLVAIVIIAALLNISRIAQADTGLFLGISGGPAWTSDIDAQPSTATGTLTLSSKLGYAVGGEIGIDFDNFRVSAEVASRKGDFDTAKSSGGGSAGMDGNYSLLTYMLNYCFTGQVAPGFKPFVNVGLGFAEATLKDLSVAGITVLNSASETKAAIQVGLGLTYDVNKNTALDCGYKFIATDTFDLKGANISFLNHSLLAGVRYKFL